MAAAKGTRPPAAGKGRRKGSQNKVTALLKDAIVMAAEAEGRDGCGKDGVVGYCRFLAKDEPKAFATLLGKVLPIQVSGDDGGAIKVVIADYDKRL